MGFELSWTWFWVILSAILVVGEIFTAGFFIIPFGIGAAAAALMAWLGGGLVWQWAVFLFVSIPTLFFLKRFSDRVTEGADLRVAADRVLDKVGIVLEEVQPHGFTGRVQVGSEEWRAASEGEERIPEGTSVVVLRVDGTHLVVRPRSVLPDGGSEGGA
jgi:membrane protein implicated in regulation of membrane protease activity